MPDEAFVWVWLPTSTEPVVAGVVERGGAGLSFSYAESYLGRDEAVALYLPELPLEPGLHDPPRGLPAAGCLRDAAPDAWGQQVIMARLVAIGRPAFADDLLTLMLESTSDRTGGMDFQSSPSEYVRRGDPAELDELVDAGARFAEGEAFSDELARALLHGSSIGGARPKALLRQGESDGAERQLIAKFSLRSDPYPVVKAEAVAMNLAARVGIDVAATEVVESAGRDVLLVERFDRPGTSGSAPGSVGERRLMVSALTILGLREEFGRYATYPLLADEVRRRFTEPQATLRELFARIVFNILVSNTDDHARNHSAFWNGRELTLTPAYDLSPQMRSGDTAAQAMAITRDGARASRLAVIMRAAGSVFNLDAGEAATIVESQVATIRGQWSDAADEARLTAAERQLLWERLILNPAVFHPEDTDFDPH